ncbi:putative methyltransferase-domain-containing protein [Scheffersomyces coipomensis]|uniref:putative methyltransferase-domain-containing protein n=1 Tax=Scheffersomyces coipomensis TaxID=1788519 RepID=UPI00315DCE59
MADIIKLLARIDQRIPIYEIFESSESLLSTICQLSTQESIVNHIKSSTIIQLNPYYIKLFIKSYITILEKKNVEIWEDLYELYCDPTILNSQELQPTDTDLLIYPINGFSITDSYQTITIKETPKIISGLNTTGLRTWEAALYLANYLNDSTLSTYDFKHKSVLELGSGTGLLSLSLLKTYGDEIEKLIVTDGSISVFDNFHETLKINHLSQEKLKCQQLLWGTTNPEHEDSFIQAPPENIDIIVAADITYDSRVLDLLCQTIDDFFKVSNTQLALISATIRNIDTITEWESQLNKWFNGNWSIKHSTLQPGDIDSLVKFKQTTPEIRIYQIINPTSLYT